MPKVTSSSDRSKRSTKKPITKGQNPQRANRQSVSQAKVTTSQQRSNRQRSSMAKITRSSNGKPAGTGSARVTTSAARDAGPTKADAQKWQSYQQSARTSGKGPVKGAPGTAGAPTNARPVVRTAASNVASARMRGALRGAAAGRAAATGAARLLGAAKATNLAGIAAETLKARPLASGTLTSAMKRGDYKPRQGPAVPKRLTQGGMDKGSFDSAFKASRTAGKKTFSWRGKKYNTKMKGE